MSLEDIFKEEDNNDDVTNKISTPIKENEDNDLEKTLEIETLDLNVYLDKDKKVEKPIEKVTNKVKKETKNNKKEEDIPVQEKDHTIQEYFINCSVLGFITAFVGAGWLINIINQI